MEARPKLEVVSGGGARSEPGPEPGPPGRASGVPVLLAGLLGALLALALIGLGLESRRAARLSERVEVLSVELSATQRALEAHRDHLQEVRTSVAELQELVARDPVSPAPEGR